MASVFAKVIKKQTLRISNLLEDLRKVKEFIKSVDAQLSTISQ